MGLLCPLRSSYAQESVTFGYSGPEMTWFDALLVTLLGMLAALGLRHGVVGLVWSVLAVLAAYTANLLGPTLGPLGAVLAALGLGLVATLSAKALQKEDALSYGLQPAPGQALLGLLGAAALGGVVIAAVALAFPLSPRVEAGGVRYIYPAPELQPALYQAVNGSVIKNRLMPLWEKPASPWHTLLLPNWDTGRGARQK